MDSESNLPLLSRLGETELGNSSPKREREERRALFLGFTLPSVLEKLSLFFFFLRSIFLFFFFVSMCEKAVKRRDFYLHQTCAVNGKEQINGKKRDRCSGVCRVRVEILCGAGTRFSSRSSDSLGF